MIRAAIVKSGSCEALTYINTYIYIHAYDQGCNSQIRLMCSAHMHTYIHIHTHMIRAAIVKSGSCAVLWATKLQHLKGSAYIH